MITLCWACPLRVGWSISMVWILLLRLFPYTFLFWSLHASVSLPLTHVTWKHPVWLVERQEIYAIQWEEYIWEEAASCMPSSLVLKGGGFYSESIYDSFRAALKLGFFSHLVNLMDFPLLICGKHQNRFSWIHDCLVPRGGLDWNSVPNGQGLDSQTFTSKMQKMATLFRWAMERKEHLKRDWITFLGTGVFGLLAG